MTAPAVNERRCTTPGCGGDYRYAAPGRNHIEGCQYPFPTVPMRTDSARQRTPLQQSLAAIVRSRLVGNDMRQRDAAAFIGISEKHLSRILNCYEEGSLTMWQRLLDFVDVDPADWSAP